ncbi:MAG: NAD(P)H-hydrate dehydratase [Bacteroidia bacterium]
MIPLLTGTEALQADQLMSQKYHVPPILLMEAAVQNTAQRIQKDFPHENVLILAGGGNNGGDGLGVARVLHQAGKNVQVLYTTPPEKLPPDALTQFRIVEALDMPLHLWTPDTQPTLEKLLAANPLVIDALVGVGLQGPLRPPLENLIRWIEKFHPIVVALDIPSGLHAHTGKIMTPPLQATKTYTFHTPKIAHFVPPAATYCGTVEVIPIGIYPKATPTPTAWLIEPNDLFLWHLPSPYTHKNRRGHVLILAGSEGKIGAAYLSALGAQKIGAGLITVAVPKKYISAFYRLPEVMTLPLEGKKFLTPKALPVLLEKLPTFDALVIGPGLGQNPETGEMLELLLPHIATHPKVLDADGLNFLAQHTSLWQYLHASTLLTPHPGEMARLLNLSLTQVQNERLESLLMLREKANAALLLKGAYTLMTQKSHPVYILPIAHGALATGGMGDLLAGMLGGLLAQGYAPHQALLLGTSIHGYVGMHIAQKRYPVTPSDLAKKIPSFLSQLAKKTLPLLYAQDKNPLYPNFWSRFSIGLHTKA